MAVRWQTYGQTNHKSPAHPTLVARPLQGSQLLMSHLEDLIAEYYDWSGYLVKRNLKVGRLAHGGWEMELDIVAFHPTTKHLVHVEPSIDAHSWKKREQRFKKKFKSGERYMFSHVFPWLDPKTPVDRMAVLVSHPKGRDVLCGARIVSIDEFMSMLREKIGACGKMAKGAISEQYPLLRTIQLAVQGYYKHLDQAEPSGRRRRP